MRAAVDLLEGHFATGYASDDEVAPARRRREQAYGALPGDGPRKRKLSEQEVLEYGVRQASSGKKSSTKVNFLDAVKGPVDRLSRAQTQPRISFEQHCKLLNLAKQRLNVSFKSDHDMLRESHRFLRTDEDEDGSWESKLARRYYDRLFKEYVICDLAGYKKNNIGFRWRTEAEVVQGKGQFFCGHKRCLSKFGLKSYEVDFKYNEAGQDKRALVKARLCEACAYKLHYRRLKAHRKKHAKKLAKQARERSSKRQSCDEDEASAVVNLDGSSDESDAPMTAGSSGAKEEEEPEPTKDEKRLLESLAWRGPDPELRTRQDDFDDYLNDLFA